jgi:hypothetical protein
LNVEDSGVNEEDKCVSPCRGVKVYTNIVCRYGAVVRSSGAYVPPGARKTPLSPPASATKSDIPKVSVNAPDGASIPDKTGPPTPTATTTNKVGMI